MITAKECIGEIKTALKQFGEYSYYDKGPNEVMDMPSICFKRMSDMDAKQIADVLAEVREYKHGERFVSEVLVDLQESAQKLDALYEDKRLADLY